MEKYVYGIMYKCIIHVKSKPKKTKKQKIAQRYLGIYFIPYIVYIIYYIGTYKYE